MPKPLLPHPNVRKCTHIKVTGQQCGSPALRGNFFSYFHTRVIKGVQRRVNMQLHSLALLEDCESIQLSIILSDAAGSRLAQKSARGVSDQG